MRCRDTSKLRMIEESRRKMKILSNDEKREIIELLRGEFNNIDGVSLAVIHGGFIESRVFRDIDVAVYLSNIILREDVIEEVRDVLEKGLNIAIDIQVLNYAPPRFTVKALRNGLVIVEKIPGLRGVLLIHAVEELKRLSRPRMIKLIQ